MTKLLNTKIEVEDDTISYLTNLHGKSKGYITLMILYTDYVYHYHFRIENLLKQKLRQKDTFISMNTYYIPKRSIETIKELKVIYVDLDVYKTDYTKSQAVGNILYSHVDDKDIPEPTRIIDSGNGLYVLWDIEPVPYKVLSLWQALEDKFCETLKYLGADEKCRDATRLLRVVGSINRKCNETVKVIYDSNKVYDIHDLKDFYLEKLEPEEKKKSRPKKFVTIYRERSLYHARLLDIVKLCELRKYDMVGYREIILFLYRYYLCCFKNDAVEALNDTLELNNEFKNPLSEREVIKATKSAERAYYSKNKSYKYKNETLINILDITSDEQRQLSTIINKSEYKRRYNAHKREVYLQKLRENSKLTRKEKVKSQQQKIATLLDKGFNQQEICSMLKIADRTYRKYKKHLDK